MWWPAIGGLVVGVGGLIQPRALGVGYDIIDDLLHGRRTATRGRSSRCWSSRRSIWAVALGSGTSGGVLAPLLIMGGALGARRSRRSCPAATGALAPGEHGGDPGRDDALAA